MASILVVDDDDLARLVVGEYLLNAGHEVTYATDGNTALRLYEEGSFAAVFLDMVMPGKSGLETLRDLLRIDGNARVIIVSGGPYSAEFAVARQIGALETLRKPATGKALPSALESALTRPQRQRGDQAGAK